DAHQPVDAADRDARGDGVEDVLDEDLEVHGVGTLARPRGAGPHPRAAEDYVAGVGAAGSRSPASLRAVHSSPGMGRWARAPFSSTSATEGAPGITETMAGWASTSCSAAARRSTSWRAHTAAMRRAFSIIAASAGR